MQLPPPEVTSHWPTSNFVNPVTRGTTLLIAGPILLLFAILIVGLRTFTRLRISRCYGIDDALILVAILPAIGHTALIIITDVKFGGNRHVWDVHLHDLIIARKINLAVITLFAASCTITKISILFFARRLMSRASSRTYNFAMLMVFVVIVTEFITFIFVVIFQCHPTDQYWTITLGASKCISENRTLTSTGIINTLTDFLVVFIPIPTIWNLQLALRRRIEIILLFSMSIVVVCSAGIARTIYTYKYTSTWDPTWAAYPVWITSMVELDVGIICASIPAINPLRTYMFSNNSADKSAINGTLTLRSRTNQSSFRLLEFRTQGSLASRGATAGDTGSQKGILYPS